MDLEDDSLSPVLWYGKSPFCGEKIDAHSLEYSVGSTIEDVTSVGRRG